MKEDLAIQISGLKKKYKLGAIGGGTLKGDIQSWWARKRGKVDPNSIIGTEDVKIGEEFYALNGIDLEVKKGEALGIIGMNGAGKSTLLKILSRVTAPSEGEVRIKGRITSMLEVGTGFHGELTGRENIYMNGAILGMTRKEVDEKIEEIIDFSECRQFIDTPVKRYSSGMYVKLAFAVAAHLDSEIMIMDEVLAVGDIHFQEKCLSKMKEESVAKGKTVLYVSHNMSTIRKLCDRCIVLDKGKIIFDGDSDEAINLYAHNSINELCDEIVLSDKYRTANSTSVVKMEHIKLLNSNGGVLGEGSLLKARLRWSAIGTLNNTAIRCTVTDNNFEPIGMAISLPMCDSEMGNNYEKDIEIDLSSLPVGTYSINLCLFQQLSEGKSVAIDTIPHAFSLKIEDLGLRDIPFTWQYWSGKVRFPDIVIK